LARHPDMDRDGLADVFPLSFLWHAVIIDPAIAVTGELSRPQPSRLWFQDCVPAPRRRR
jgi:hypothetical protein